MKRELTLSLISCTLAGVASGGTILSDEFDDPTGGQVITLVNGGLFTVGNNTATGLKAFAGSRMIYTSIQDSLPGGNSVETAVNTLTSPGNFQLSSTINVDAVATIDYGTDETTPYFNLSPYTGFALKGVLNDVPTTYHIVLLSAGGISESSISVSSGFSGDLFFPWDQFKDGGDPDFPFPSADRAHLEWIQVGIDPQRGGDVSINAITAVPEPISTGCVSGLALVAVGAWHRNQRRSVVHPVPVEEPQENSPS